MNPKSRTYNPWGHVSKAERAARIAEAKRTSAYLRVSKELEWEELKTLIEDIHYKRTADLDAAKKRMNELCDALNERGISDADIEAAL